VSGNGVFLAGKDIVPYQVTTSGAVGIAGVKNPLFGSASCRDALNALITGPRQHLLEAEYTKITKRSVDIEMSLNPKLSASPASDAFAALGANSLASQLSMVARMIKLRDELSVKRQVFFVSLGGFDTHSGLVTNHPELLAQVASAMDAFNKAMIELGMDNNVTAFTASEFGRTLNSNGDGSDHGGGSMHFALGGAVNGKNFYGKAPVPGNNGPDDVGRGRLVPTTSVDQFGATLGTWFGVSATELADVFPNLKEFSAKDLGFMKPPV
jgi:uncharacterized protein (DUF1501 family)